MSEEYLKDSYKYNDIITFEDAEQFVKQFINTYTDDNKSFPPIINITLELDKNDKAGYIDPLFMTYLYLLVAETNINIIFTITGTRNKSMKDFRVY